MTQIHENQKRDGKTRWIKILLLAVGCMVATVSGCGFYAIYKLRGVMEESGYVEEWAEGIDGESVNSVSYGEKEWNKIDVYFPMELVPEKSHSAFFYVHGGAWTGGNRRDMTAFARRMTKAGYVSASLEYMLANEKNREEYSIVTVLNEIDAALVQLKETALERGIELERVAMGGDSAGGHIISLYAYSRGKDAPLPVAFIAPRVAPIDFHVDAWTPVLKPEVVGLLVSMMTQRQTFLNATEISEPNEETEALIKSISPIAFLSSENTIPTVAAYGGKDPLVGVNHCAKLKKRFEELGAKRFEDVSPDDVDSIVFDCIEYPRSGHMLESDPDCAKKFHELVLKYAERYLIERVSAEDNTRESETE